MAEVCITRPLPELQGARAPKYSSKREEEKTVRREAEARGNNNTEPCLKKRSAAAADLSVTGCSSDGQVRSSGLSSKGTVIQQSWLPNQ